MNFERVMELAKAIGFKEMFFKVKLFDSCNNPDHRWRVTLDSESGRELYDYGGTPEEALGGIEKAIVNEIESQALSHEKIAARFRAALCPSEAGK